MIYFEGYLPADKQQNTPMSSLRTWVMPAMLATLEVPELSLIVAVH
jgi:hypothetical protein